MVVIPFQERSVLSPKAEGGVLVLHSDVPCWTLGSSLEWPVESDPRRAQWVGQGDTEPRNGGLGDAGGLEPGREWAWGLTNPL